MKKLVLLLVCVFCVSLLAPALALTPAETVGTWYLIRSKYYSNPYGVPMDESRMELNRDKSVTLVLQGKEMTGTWVIEDDKVKVRTEVEDFGTMYYDFTLENGELLCDSVKHPDTHYYEDTFGREKPENPIPAVVEETVEDAYFGTYEIAFTVNNGMVYPVEGGSETLQCVIEFAQVIVTGSGRKSDSSDPTIQMTNFVDGVLTCGVGGITEEYDSEAELTIAKTEKGITVTSSEDPETVYYLNAVEAAE